MALVFTLIKAESWGWSSARTLAGFAVAAALIAAFVWIERRHEDPLVPLGIFKNRSLAASDATMLVVAAALFGMFFFCTLYLQQVLGYSALKTGRRLHAVQPHPRSAPRAPPRAWSTASRRNRCW